MNCAKAGGGADADIKGINDIYLLEIHYIIVIMFSNKFLLNDGSNGRVALKEQRMK